MSLLFHHKYFTFSPAAFLQTLLLNASVFVLFVFCRLSFYTNDIMITESKYDLAADFF